MQAQSSSQEITKKSASNLALAFILLPKEKRDAMVSLYAFCRMVDDIADEETSPVETRRAELNRWREGHGRSATEELRISLYWKNSRRSFVSTAFLMS